MPFTAPNPKLYTKQLKLNKKQFETQLETEINEDIIAELNLKISIINKIIG